MKQKVLKKEGGTRPKFTLACGVLTAIAFVSMVQAFFVFFKSHHTVDQLSSIFTHKHYPHGQREYSGGHSSPASLPFITTHNNIYNDSAIDTRFVNGSSSLPMFSDDGKDMILSSLIERSSDSWSLHITTFFLSAAMVDPSEPRQYKVFPSIVLQLILIFA
jgi:hypothetical protein